MSEESWRDGLPEDMRGRFEEFKTPADLMKGYSGLVSKMGANPIVRPGDDATDEQRAEYQKTLARELGVPDNLDDYRLEDGLIPEEHKDLINGEQIDALRQKAFELGVPPRAFNELAKAKIQADIEAIRSVQDMVTQQHEKAIADLKEKWGDKYDEKVALAVKAASKFYPEIAEQGSEMNQRYGNDPVIIQMLADMAAKMGEGSIERGGDMSKVSMTRDDARKLLQKSLDKSLSFEERDEAARQAREAYKALS